MSKITGAYFAVHYYTKCALLQTGCETSKIHACNIKICMVSFSHSVYVSLVKDKRIKEVYHCKKVIRFLDRKSSWDFFAVVEAMMMTT